MVIFHTSTLTLGGSIENVNVCKLDMGKKEANIQDKRKFEKMAINKYIIFINFNVFTCLSLG